MLIEELFYIKTGKIFCIKKENGLKYEKEIFRIKRCLFKASIVIVIYIGPLLLPLKKHFWPVKAIGGKLSLSLSLSSQLPLPLQNSETSFDQKCEKVKLDCVNI